MNELRWILAAIGVVVIGAIWWWSARRSTQAPGHAELRESTQNTPHAPHASPLHTSHGSHGAPTPRFAGTAEERAPYLTSRDPRTIGPLEPLSIHTDDSNPSLDFDEPMSPYADPLPPQGSTSNSTSNSTSSPVMGASAGREPPSPPAAARAMPAAASVSLEPAATELHATAQAASSCRQPDDAAALGEQQARAAAPARHEPHPAEPASPPGAPWGRGIERSAGLERSSGAVERSPGLERSSAFERTAPPSREASREPSEQRIIAVRVCTVNEARWPGRKLMAVLEAHGLAYGRYQVFHRRHVDGRSIFCVASLTEPGAFDAQRMADEEYRGITLFAVLPGPLPPLQTLDELLLTAREMARDLSATIQDDRGLPFSPQRAGLLREDIARFELKVADARP